MENRIHVYAIPAVKALEEYREEEFDYKWTARTLQKGIEVRTHTSNSLNGVAVNLASVIKDYMPHLTTFFFPVQADKKTGRSLTNAESEAFREAFLKALTQ